MLYLDTFVKYLKCLVRVDSLSLEDIEVFSKVIELFRLHEDNQDDDDLTKKKESRSNFMSLIDGFIGLD